MMRASARGNPLITLIVTCLGTFIVLLDSSIVTLALPSIQASLHAHLLDLQWTVDAFTLPFAALLLTAGTLGDRFGRKRLFLVGLVLFLSGSALCGLAPSLSWLIVGRVIQGVGGAALSPGSLSILAAAYPEPRARARVVGVWSGISGLALAAGPLAGGLLIQVSSWPAIFFVNLPIGVVALILGWFGLAESRNPDARRIDLFGQILVTGLLTCLIMALIESSSLGWTSPTILGLCLATVVLLIVFLLVEARVREPLLPLGLFRSRVFSVANVATLVLGFVILGVVFFLAQFFQAVQGSTALEAGLETLPVTVGTFLVSPLAGVVTARTSPRLPSVLGALLSAASLFLLLDLSPLSSFASIWWKLAMLGVGVGLMLSPLTVAVLSATPTKRTGLASSMASTSRQIGSTLGVAVLGALVLQQFAGNIVSQLVQRGIPAPISARIAGAVAAAGAQASQVPLPVHLPISLAALHQAIGLAFVDALHGSFLFSGLAMLVTAVLVFALFPGKRAADAAERKAVVQARETPVASAAQPVAVNLKATR